MAGVTDQPFRQLCRDLGAGLVVSEMVTSDTRLWHTRKSKLRLNHSDEAEPISVQIAGGEPAMMANAAIANVQLGAQIIDINMGCPAKKVCNKAAGSALMKDESLVAEILEAVVSAVDVPVTLKIRTGWDETHRNAPTIAKIAESSGIAALAIHGRTKACAFKGDAEYDTMARVKQSISIPVFANGDITNAIKAKSVIDYTGADAVMIGRAAQGNPWIFQSINQFLATGIVPAAPSLQRVLDTLQAHIKALHEFYGELMGVRIARKHLGWYLLAQGFTKSDFKHINTLNDASAQLTAIKTLFQTHTVLKESIA